MAGISKKEREFKKALKSVSNVISKKGFLTDPQTIAKLMVKQHSIQSIANISKITPETLNKMSDKDALATMRFLRKTINNELNNINKTTPNTGLLLNNGEKFSRIKSNETRAELLGHLKSYMQVYNDEIYSDKEMRQTVNDKFNQLRQTVKDRSNIEDKQLDKMIKQAKNSWIDWGKSFGLDSGESYRYIQDNKCNMTKRELYNGFVDIMIQNYNRDREIDEMLGLDNKPDIDEVGRSRII